MAVEPELAQLVVTELLKPSRPWGWGDYLGSAVLFGIVLGYFFIEASVPRIFMWLVRGFRRLIGLTPEESEQSVERSKDE